MFVIKKNYNNNDLKKKRINPHAYFDISRFGQAEKIKLNTLTVCLAEK